MRIYENSLRQMLKGQISNYKRGKRDVHEEFRRAEEIALKPTSDYLFVPFPVLRFVLSAWTSMRK